jgi:L-aspartate oxidase
MKRGEPCAFLDISHVEPASVLSHFPNIAAHCAAHGLDMTREPIPVTPAMHYTCGGVRTGVDAATGVKGLFVCGEAAYTGLHGANRLASNSLLEGLVFGRGAAFAATAHATLAASSPRVEALHRAASSTSGRHLYVAKPGAAHHAREEVVAAALVQLRRDVQDTMWQHAGIVRTTASLRCALLCIHELGALAAALPVKGGSAALATAWYEVANLLTVAELVVVSALARKESRGLHYTLDFPHKLESERRPTLIHHPLQVPRRERTPYLPEGYAKAFWERPGSWRVGGYSVPLCAVYTQPLALCVSLCCRRREPLTPCTPSASTGRASRRPTRSRCRSA